MELGKEGFQENIAKRERVIGLLVKRLELFFYLFSKIDKQNAIFVKILFIILLLPVININIFLYVEILLKKTKKILKLD